MMDDPRTMEIDHNTMFADDFINYEALFMTIVNKYRSLEFVDTFTHHDVLSDSASVSDLGNNRPKEKTMSTASNDAVVRLYYDGFSVDVDGCYKGMFCFMRKFESYLYHYMTKTLRNPFKIHTPDLFMSTGEALLKDIYVWNSEMLPDLMEAMKYDCIRLLRHLSVEQVNELLSHNLCGLFTSEADKPNQ